MQRYALSRSQMQAIEKSAFAEGVSSLLLMEHAAESVFRFIKRKLHGVQGKKAVFVCGTGNNGGDGLAASRLFCLAGGYPIIVMTGDPSTAEARQNLNYLRYHGVPIRGNIPDEKVDIVIDAIFGIGLNRALNDSLIELIKKINQMECPRLSLDIPSGMDADTGEIYGICVNANDTLCFHAVKKGLLFADRQLSGRIHVCDIGLRHEQDINGLPYYLSEDLDDLLPPRSLSAHKGSCGRIAVFAGSIGKAGAAAMCALAALKSGAGLVTIICPPQIIPQLQVIVPNAMCVEWDKAEDVSFDVLAAGCGIGMSDKALEILLKLLKKSKKTVLDADGLNLLQRYDYAIPDGTILTPHMLEGARLLNASLESVLNNPLYSAQTIAEKYHCTCVLKSAVTFISDEKGSALNVVGSPALAKGGSGDALCGIIAAQLYETADPFSAARVACLRMGTASVKAEKKYGQRGLLTTELLKSLR